MSERSYTDEELGLIIRRAAQIQGSDLERTHTLADVQQIAAQVGIPTQLVAAVAEDLDGTSEGIGQRHRLFGHPGRFISSAVIDRRVPPQAYPAIVNRIRSELRLVGQAAELGSALEWTDGAHWADGSMIITVTPQGHATKVRVETNLQPLRTKSFVAWPLMATCVGTIVSLEAGAGPLGVASAMAGSAIGGFGVAAALWKLAARGAQARVERLRTILASQLHSWSPSEGPAAEQDVGGGPHGR